MTAALPFRAARAAVFAVVCLGLTMAGHRLGGGSVTGPAMAAGLLLAFGAGLAASGRERPLAVILPLLAGVQAVLHLLFSLTHDLTLDLTHDLTHDAVAHAALGHAHHGLASGAGMLVAHGWATGLTALWLARGEAALWGTLRRLTIRLCRVLVAGPPPVHEPVALVAAPEPGRLVSAVLACAAPRRGPPFTRVLLSSG